MDLVTGGTTVITDTGSISGSGDGTTVITDTGSVSGSGDGTTVITDTGSSGDGTMTIASISVLFFIALLWI